MFNRKALLILMCLVAVGVIYVGQAICQQGEPNQGPQGRRARGAGFDPAQMRQRMTDRMREALGASDEEWKALEPKVEKVMTLSMETRGGMGMMGRGRTGRGPTSQPSPEAQTEAAKAAQALSTVLENKEAKPDEIKTSLQNLRDARAKAKTELEQAQKDLREVLTVRQEAQLVLMGMLD
jgi:hypothetical protein